MTDFADHLLAHVRTLLKRHPAFTGVTRDEFDNNVLADLERTLRENIEDWDDQIERAYEQGRADAEADREYEAEMEKRAAKKAKRVKSQRTQNQEEHHADR